MKTAEAIMQGESRLRHDMVLLRRVKPRTERIGGAFHTEVVYEKHSSGLAISDPGREITRCEVMKVGPECRLRPGQMVIVRAGDKLAGLQWYEDGYDYVMTKEDDEISPDIIFKYEVRDSERD